MPIKIVVNKCFGGFNLSQNAQDYLLAAEPNLFSWVEEDQEWFLKDYKLPDVRALRSSPTLVRMVEKEPESVNGPHADLAVVEIPDNMEWEIGEYDGREWVQECHRKWYAKWEDD